MGNQAGEGFGAGFNYGMKPAIDRANSLADLKAKIDQLGKFDPAQMNEFQRAALSGKSGVNPLDLVVASLIQDRFGVGGMSGGMTKVQDEAGNYFMQDAEGNLYNMDGSPVGGE